MSLTKPEVEEKVQILMGQIAAAQEAYQGFRKQVIDRRITLLKKHGLFEALQRLDAKLIEAETKGNARVKELDEERTKYKWLLTVLEGEAEGATVEEVATEELTADVEEVPAETLAVEAKALKKKAPKKKAPRKRAPKKAEAKDAAPANGAGVEESVADGIIKSEEVGVDDDNVDNLSIPTF